MYPPIQPPPSQLDPKALEPVQLLATLLREAAAELTSLADGASPAAGAMTGAIGSGRACDASVALRRWSGPLRDRFVRLIDHELELAATVRLRLVQEADEWDRFRLLAAEAHQARLRAEAVTPPHPG
jgi:hypothetical protein